MSNPATIDVEGTRKAWLRHGLGELPFWLEHIDTKTGYLIDEQNAGRFRYIEHAELIFDYCALINRLAQISLREHGAIQLKDIVPWLASFTGWPEHVADAFWYCVRNPTLHVGRAWSMADYGRRLDGAKVKAGLHPSIAFEQIDPDNNPASGIGWSQVDWRPVENEIRITFDLPGVRKIAEQILNSVREQVQSMTEQDLRKLQKLNKRIPFFVVSPPDSPTE